MQETATLAAAITHVNTAAALTAKIRSEQSQKREGDAFLQLAKLTGTLADIKLALVEAEGLLREKEETIRKMKAVKRENGGLFFDGEVWWGEEAAVPFCPICMKSQGEKTPLTHVAQEGWIQEHYACPSCRRVFSV